MPRAGASAISATSARLSSRRGAASCSAAPPNQSRTGAESAAGRKCLCNALMANVGLAQARPDGDELPLVTSGDDVARLPELLRGRERYTAADVLEHLLGGS